MNMNARRKSLSFRTVNILVFVVLLLAAVILTDSILFSNWRASAEESATTLAADSNKEAFSHIDAFMELPQLVNDMNRKILEHGIVDLSSQTERDKYFVSILRSLNEDIYSFSFGSETGAYYGARRDPGGLIQIMRNDTSTGGNSWYYSVNGDMTAGQLALQAGKFDPRTRDWYKVAQRTGLPTYSPVYKHFILDDLTVSAAAPIHGASGQPIGVLGTHIALTSISRYMQEIARDHQGYAAIVERDSGLLVANSFGARNFESISPNDIRRFALSETEMKPLAAAFSRYREQPDSQMRIPDGSDSLLVELTEFRKYGLDWIVITAIPQSIFMSGLSQSIRFALILTVLALLVSIVIYYLITNRYLKPIGNLIAAAEHFTRGDLSRRVTVVRDDEIGRISRAFNNMADTLERLVDHLEETVQERTEALESSNESLIQADRNKNEFISALSHELRNPLAAIVAGLSVLDMARDPDRRERAKDIIQRQAAQLSHLVDDLLDITRITRNKISLRKERVDVSEIAARTLDSQRALFEGKGIRLAADIRDRGLYMAADPVRLDQIIGNLLHNAFKFTDAGGLTKLMVARHGDREAVICVKDTGIGIQPEYVASLFDPFMQADNSLDRRLGGLGLGLSIVKGIAELHGGRVSVESAGLGHGSEFCIFLPLADPDAPIADGPEEAP